MLATCRRRRRALRNGPDSVSFVAESLRNSTTKSCRKTTSILVLMFLKHEPHDHSAIPAHRHRH